MPSSALNNGFSGLRALASVEHSVFGLEPQKSLDLGTIAVRENKNSIYMTLKN